MKEIKTLQTITEWEEAKQSIPEQGLLIVKFSPRCPISRGVERDFDEWYNLLDGSQGFRCIKVDVVNARDLSRHIAQELSVRHESPQVIWLLPNLKVYWHASHWEIKGSALDVQLEALKK